MTRFALAAAALVAAFAATPGVAGSQLFKCLEGGRTVYQQQACPITSQAESMASGASASPAKAASEPATKLAARVKPPSPGASSALATPR